MPVVVTPELPRVYVWIRGFCRVLMGLFFRRIHVTGLENVPESGGGILVAWHPNGLIDPGLLVTQFPR